MAPPVPDYAPRGGAGHDERHCGRVRRRPRGVTREARVEPGEVAFPREPVVGGALEGAGQELLRQGDRQNRIAMTFAEASLAGACGPPEGALQHEPDAVL